jgi:hypothetical protein
MRNKARAAVCGLALALAAMAPAKLLAENAPSASTSADPLYDTQRIAFEALPEADRRAVQDALIWTGHYLGVIDGVFGKRTRDAIVAYQTAAKAPADGMVDSAQLAAMIGAAQKARAAVRFQIFTDERTGVKIGAPLKILDKRIVNEAGVRLTKADGSIALDLSNIAGADAKMSMLFGALTADAPGRKITLKLNRPDFFVVSWEEDGRKFYERMAKAPTGFPDPAAARGFRFAYPAAQSADFDRIGVAIADSFEPFPTAMASAGPGTVAASATAPATPPTPPPAPARPFFAATGLLVAPGQALSAISEAECPNPTIDGKPAKFVRDDRQIGLSLLSIDGASNAPVGAPSFGALGPDLVALSYSAEEPGGRVVLDVTSASLMPPGPPPASPLLLASLSKSARGAPVFDRMGALVAMIAQTGVEPKLVAGVAPLAPHGAIDGDHIRQFLSLAPGPTAKTADGALQGAGKIAAAERAYVVAISCRR